MVMAHKYAQKKAQIVLQPMNHLYLQTDFQRLPELDPIRSKATETDKCEKVGLYLQQEYSAPWR